MKSALGRQLPPNQVSPGSSHCTSCVGFYNEGTEKKMREGGLSLIFFNLECVQSEKFELDSHFEALAFVC